MFCHERQQHAELSAPIANVVLPDHFVTKGLQHSGNAVTDNGAAQVADVHFFCQVRPRIIDHHAVTFRAVLRCCTGLGNEMWGQFNVDEARACDGQVLSDVGQVEGVDDLLGYLSGIAAGAFSRCHNTIGLVVAEFGTARRLQ